MLSPDSKLAFSVSLESEGLNIRKVKVDSKGRISIPSEIRKNFGLEEGFEIEMVFDLRKNFVILVFDNGQDGVVGSTEVCGAPSSGSKESMTQVKPESSETPGPGPDKEVEK